MTETASLLQEILKSSDYALTIFSEAEINALTLHDKNGKPHLYDAIDNKERPAKPEEIVRQLFLAQLLHKYKYPKSRIRVEVGVYFGSTIAEKRADIIVYDKDSPTTAYLIVEVKKPKRKDGIEQLKSYCNAEGAPIAVWTNGGELVGLHREGTNLYQNLAELPRADQTLAEVINQPVTIDELRKHNKLVTENRTLKNIILDLQELALANAGVDAFDEVFKLIYTKLYDEWKAENDRPNRRVEFRISGENHAELSRKITGLFNEAKQKWSGVFYRDQRIELNHSALAVCVSFLQDIALFNSNLQVIDEAFEYLVTQVYKGDKGQYFTPRHVIDMCVKMLHPKKNEYVIDTAAGSCGFTIHTFMHVWGKGITAQGPTRAQADYAAEYVYGTDFDLRSVQTAKAINLIAGDGRTNVYRLNSLAPHEWDEDARVGMKKRLKRFPDDTAAEEDNQENFREFDFDLVLTNPPFAGDIKDSKILYRYDLSKQWKAVDLDKIAASKHPELERYVETGRYQTNQSRDILFIERNLQFLKPGGRMAIVLPQGRFNNVSDGATRQWIAQRARILAVIGLHPNTFKPHTGTKTSVLFLQKWNDDPEAGALCPKVDDYPLFFATSERGGKDNSGEYIMLDNEDGLPRRDEHGHYLVDHDLDEIADAFVDYARKYNFSFWQERN